MFRNRMAGHIRFAWFLAALLAAFIVRSNAQTLFSSTLPTMETKLDAKGLELVLSAKTVAVIATAQPLITKGNGATVRVTYRRGRVGPEKAKGDVEKVLSKWGAFSLVGDPTQADLVLVIEEQTLKPGLLTDKVRLRDTLGVFPTGGPGVAPPLWVGIDTESTLAAGSGLTRPDAEGVVEKFRRDVENARNRLK